jgi:choline dehydrogenase-like flavoprotein
MTLKIWVARDKDTLRVISDQNRIPIEDLLSLNPDIHHPDQNIAGNPVKLPFYDGDVRPEAIPPTCQISEDFLEQWIQLTPLKKMAENEYDVLIVGTGAGGGSVLWRLCEQWSKTGKRIGIIERGKLEMPTHGRNLPTMNRTRLDKYLRYLSNPLKGSYPDFIGARDVFCLGGRTIFWDLVSSRFNFSLIPDWPVAEKEMETYYDMAERIMNVTHDYAKGSFITETLLDRLQQGGFPESRYMPIAADLQPTKFGEVHSDIFFSSISLLAKASYIKPFDLAINARAVQVLVDKHANVTGVKVMSPDKNSYLLKAKTIVLAASTYETPRLLLHSGIYGKAIGHYMTNQVFMMASGTMNRYEFPELIGDLNILIPATTEKPYQVRLSGPAGYDWYPSAEVRPLVENLMLNLLCFGHIEPRYENGITLNPNRKDEFGVPEIEVHFSFSETEQAEIRNMVKTIKQISSVTGIRLLTEKGQDKMCLVPSGDLHHTSGTCRMGDDPSTSVTDRYGQVHGITGLYVADNSVLPFIGSENPTLTTVALAIRTADHIVRTAGLIK